MALFEGVVFLFFGVGLLIVTWRSLTSGWLPCGPNGLKGRLEFRRDEQPVGYWVMFVVYGAGGIWLLVYALSLLTGQAEPLPLSSYQPSLDIGEESSIELVLRASGFLRSGWSTCPVAVYRLG